MKRNSHPALFLNTMLFLSLVALFFLSACSERESTEPAKVEISSEQLLKLIPQVHADLGQIRDVALKYKEEKGAEAPNSRVLKGYLDAWPKPPVDIRDETFKFEWNYFVNGSIGDMGGPSEAQDTVVFLEGVTEQVCFEYNRTYAGQKDKVWDFVGKTERPDAETWCENGGNPYRIIRVVSLY